MSFVQTAAHEEVSYFGFRERERERFISSTIGLQPVSKAPFVWS